MSGEGKGDPVDFYVADHMHMGVKCRLTGPGGREGGEAGVAIYFCKATNHDEAMRLGMFFENAHQMDDFIGGLVRARNATWGAQ